MISKPLSKEEWRHLKYLLMKKGYTSDQADKELGLVVETIKKNRQKPIKEKITFPEAFNRLKQGSGGMR